MVVSIKPSSNLHSLAFSTMMSKMTSSDSEINLLKNDPKEGSGWFFDEKHHEDTKKFGDYHRPDQAAREKIIKFLS